MAEKCGNKTHFAPFCLRTIKAQNLTAFAVFVINRSNYVRKQGKSLQMEENKNEEKNPIYINMHKSHLSMSDGLHRQYGKEEK